jgi:hypothetical protein
MPHDAITAAGSELLAARHRQWTVVASAPDSVWQGTLAGGTPAALPGAPS